MQCQKDCTRNIAPRPIVVYARASLQLLVSDRKAEPGPEIAKVGAVDHAVAVAVALG